MEIQQNHEKRKSDSSDSWDPQQEDFTDKTQPSLFQKITIKYNDQTIQKNIDLQCEKPIINSQLFPFDDQQNEQRINLQQTQQEPSEKMGAKDKMPCEEQGAKTNSKPMDDGEALFNPIQDDQNQNWLRKKLKKQFVETAKIQRPLTCPQCFTQICYKYEANKNLSKNMTKKDHFSGSDKPLVSQKTYKARNVDNVDIQEHKIIRNRFAEQKMTKQEFNESRQVNSKGSDKKLQQYERELKERYQAINVKILISCSQCGLQIGYWDANQQLYVLFNVI